MCEAIYITSNEGMYYNVFLVIHNKVGYIVSVWPGRKATTPCPCCLLSHHQEAIMSAVKQAITTKVIEGKVVWYEEATNGMQFGPLKNSFFNLGSKRNFFDLPKELPKHLFTKIKKEMRKHTK